MLNCSVIVCKCRRERIWRRRGAGWRSWRGAVRRKRNWSQVSQKVRESSSGCSCSRWANPMFSTEFLHWNISVTQHIVFVCGNIQKVSTGSRNCAILVSYHWKHVKHRTAQHDWTKSDKSPRNEVIKTAKDLFLHLFMGLLYQYTEDKSLILL